MASNCGGNNIEFVLSNSVFEAWRKLTPDGQPSLIFGLGNKGGGTTLKLQKDKHFTTLHIEGKDDHQSVLEAGSAGIRCTFISLSLPTWPNDNAATKDNQEDTQAGKIITKPENPPEIAATNNASTTTEESSMKNLTAVQLLQNMGIVQGLDSSTVYVIQATGEEIHDLQSSSLNRSSVESTNEENYTNVEGESEQTVTFTSSSEGNINSENVIDLQSMQDSSITDKDTTQANTEPSEFTEASQTGSEDYSTMVPVQKIPVAAEEHHKATVVDLDGRCVSVDVIDQTKLDQNLIQEITIDGNYIRLSDIYQVGGNMSSLSADNDSFNNSTQKPGEEYSLTTEDGVVTFSSNLDSGIENSVVSEVSTEQKSTNDQNKSETVASLLQRKQNTPAVSLQVKQISRLLSKNESTGVATQMTSETPVQEHDEQGAEGEMGLVVKSMSTLTKEWETASTFTPTQETAAVYRCYICDVGLQSMDLLSEHFSKAHNVQTNYAVAGNKESKGRGKRKSQSYGPGRKRTKLENAPIVYKKVPVDYVVHTLEGSEVVTKDMDFDKSFDDKEVDNVEEVAVTSATPPVKMEDPDYEPDESEDGTLTKEDVDIKKLPKTKEETLWTCSLCNKAFEKPHWLVAHLNFKHKDHATRQQLIEEVDTKHQEIKQVCRLCNETFRGYSIVNHLKKVHKGENDLATHVHNAEKNYRDNLKKRKDADTSDRVNCPACNVEISGSSLLHHLKFSCKAKEKEKVFKCSKCDYQTHDPSLMKKHNECKHSNSTHVCHICGKNFATRQYLCTHLRYRHKVSVSGKPIHFFECQYCHKTFPTKDHLQNHIGTHTGEQPFSCDICDRTFSRRSTMMAHRRMVHFGQYRYNCERCGHGIEKKEYLSKHRCRKSLVRKQTEKIKQQQVVLESVHSNIKDEPVATQ